MSDRTCVKCGWEIGEDERPWTVTGACTGTAECAAGASVLVCEKCYDEHNTATEAA
jgi:hypothetical protein